jgi:AcrR family transcriptional regulator
MPTPARTSLEAIIRAARGVLEAEGLDGLTMQRVADAVGVRGPSLYKRVRDRTDLIRLSVDDAARELTVALDDAADADDPRVNLRALADTLRRFAHAYPTSFGLLFAPTRGDVRLGPDTLAASSRAVLETAGALAGSARALEAARTVVAWAYGFISMELAGAFQLGGDVDVAYSYGVDRITEAIALRD